MLDLPSSRQRQVIGSVNVRDLGDLPTTDGRRVASGRIYRSDYPAFAADAATVRELGLRTVIDLRLRNEAEAECADWSGLGVAYERISVVAGKRDSWHAGYPSYLEHRPEAVVAAVRAVMRSSGHPTLFHCAAGKDRTGVIAALLLSALGVAPEVVVADYVLTEPAVPAILERLRPFEPYTTMLRDATVETQRPKPENMVALLEHLDAAGGPQAWLLANGLPEEELDAFRAEMLD